MNQSQAEHPLQALEDLKKGPEERYDRSRGVLVGSRCEDCSVVVYPMGLACYRCRGSRLTTHDLPREGVLQSFTHVQVSSSRPVPYSIGYVDLPGDVRILAPLKASPGEMACDMPVRLVSDENGWAFEIVARSGSDV